MRSILAVLVSSLFAVFALLVLVSENPGTPNRSLTLHTERLSDLGEGLLKIFLVQGRRQSTEDAAMIARAQQRLEESGFYSGPLDGVMNPGTHEALRSFQQSNQLKLTGEVDRETARELGVQQ